VQIAAVGDTILSRVLFALCDDGTLWLMPVRGEHRHWEQLPPIPSSSDSPASDELLPSG
jgi:hypothetical protein